MHDYHLTISRSLYLLLERIANKLNITVNRLIRIFIYLTINHIDMLFQDFGRQERSHYESVDVGGIKHIHIWMRKEIYQRLKWLHGNYNNYSVAQIVRRCIFFILKMLNEYGSLAAVMDELQKLEIATREFTESSNERGFLKNLPKIRHLFGSNHVSYEVISLFVESFTIWLDLIVKLTE